MTKVEVFAPAKVNLSLHVTGQRADGYHLLDSLVMFADVGDRVTVARADDMAMRVTGPLAEGVPADARNLCWKAAEAFGEPVSITLDKHLPAAAGIGGGSSDAAAVLRAMEELFGRPFDRDPASLGADVPVCRIGHAAHMRGIGDWVQPLLMEPLSAVLVNPGVAVSTPAVFRAMTRRDNPEMTAWPDGGGAAAAMDWIAAQRNDMEAAAIGLQPEIATVLAAISACEGVVLARMSGSGATCFGLFHDAENAQRAARALARPGWWVRAVALR